MEFVQHEIEHVSPVGRLIILSGKNYSFCLAWEWKWNRLVIVDKWRVDGQLTNNMFWLWFQHSGNLRCQTSIFVSNSTLCYVLQQFCPCGLTDCDPAPQLPVLWSENDICLLNMAVIHMHVYVHACLSLPKLYILTDVNGFRHVAVCLKITRPTSWFHRKRQILKHTSHCITFLLMLDQTDNWSSQRDSY